jgi:hypothetical protein
MLFVIQKNRYSGKPNKSFQIAGDPEEDSLAVGQDAVGGLHL